MENSKFETSEGLHLEGIEREECAAAVEASLDTAFGGRGGADDPIEVPESHEEARQDPDSPVELVSAEEHILLEESQDAL